jgi:probable rRNA maturation factor
MYAGERPVLPDPGPPDAPEELGDVAIAWDTCAREAQSQGKPMEAHVTHLVVHAVLHLLGYDHVEDADATLMEAEEVRILASLGLPDPY